VRHIPAARDIGERERGERDKQVMKKEREDCGWVRRRSSCVMSQTMSP
jgi:hypothetical protein